jgi:hypothetical protein
MVGVVRCNFVQTAPSKRKLDGTNLGTFFEHLGTTMGTSDYAWFCLRRDARFGLQFTGRVARCQRDLHQRVRASLPMRGIPSCEAELAGGACDFRSISQSLGYRPPGNAPGPTLDLLSCIVSLVVTRTN